jgi:integrase
MAIEISGPFLNRDLRPTDAQGVNGPALLVPVLTKEETLRLPGQLPCMHGLMVRLLYGSGLCLMECVWLRVENLEFGRRATVVRDGKGEQDRDTGLEYAERAVSIDINDSVLITHCDLIECQDASLP